MKGAEVNRTGKIPVNYSQRDKAKEKGMYKEHKEHISWKDRLRKEREGYGSSVVRAIDMDIIGSVPLDKESQIKIFSQLQAKKYENESEKLKSNHRRMLNLSMLERKEKLVDFMNEQRRLQRDGSNESSNKNEHQQSFDNGGQQQNASSRYLPPLLPRGGNGTQLQKNYYLAHSLDLSQPDYVHVQFQDGIPFVQRHKKNKQFVQMDPRYHQAHEESPFDYQDGLLQKNNQKVVNRQLSPEEMRESILQTRKTMQQPKNVRKYQNESADSPFTQSYTEKKVVEASKEQSKRILKSLETLQPVSQRSNILIRQPMALPPVENRTIDPNDQVPASQRLVLASNRAASQLNQTPFLPQSGDQLFLRPKPIAQSPPPAPYEDRLFGNPKRNILHNHMAQLESQLNAQISGKRQSGMMLDNGRQSALAPPNIMGSPFYYATGSGRHSIIGQR